MLPWKALHPPLPPAAWCLCVSWKHNALSFVCFVIISIMWSWEFSFHLALFRAKCFPFVCWATSGLLDLFCCDFYTAMFRLERFSQEAVLCNSDSVINMNVFSSHVKFTSVKRENSISYVICCWNINWHMEGNLVQYNVQLNFDIKLPYLNFMI